LPAREIEILTVAFGASVGRGDFAIGGDFTSAAVGYNDAWTRESAAGT